MRIGPVELATNLLLAPIAGYCDLAFRIVARSCGGIGLACTDLLSPHGLLKGGQQSLDLARTREDDQPIGMQLYGADAALLADAGRWAVDHGATVVDINMGCPVDKVTKKNGGSMLLCTPDSTVALAERVARAVDQASGGRVPLTCKIRLGWDDSQIVGPALAARLARAGAAAITVHGRTTEQMFKPSVRLEGIRAVVEAVGAVSDIPVIGNGDVSSAEDCLRMLRETGCRGVMIGRAALAYPWLFRECWAAQRGEAAPEPPSEAEKLALICRYFDLMLEFRTEHYAMTQIRRRIAWFGRKLGPCKPLKERIRLAAGPAEVRAALDEFEAGGLRVFPRGEGRVEAAEEAETAVV